MTGNAQNSFPASGNVGIGTTAPADNLEVKGANTGVRISGSLNDDLFLNFGAGGTVYHQIKSNASGGFLDIIAGGSAGGGGHNIRFITDNVEKMRLTSNGNIGIGTVNPLSKLDVNGTSIFRNSLMVDYGTANKFVQLRDDGLYMSRISDGSYPNAIRANDNYLTYDTRLGHRFAVNELLGLSIAENGKVGVGIYAPTANLDVLGSAKINISNNSDNFIVKASGAQNWNPFVDFKVNDADGVSNAYGLNVLAYNDYQNRVLKINQYNSTAVMFTGGMFRFADLTAFEGGITNQNHADFDIKLRFNSSNSNPTAIRFYSENLGYTPIMSVMQTGNVGIGNSAPSERLEVVGNIKTTGLVLTANAGAGKVLTSDANGNASWQTSLGGSGTGNWSSSGSNIYNANAGLVVIGAVPATLPIDANLKLAVNGNIYAQKLKITQDGWADYVFDPGYHLRPLRELQSFIQTNKHLPEIPSAAEVEKNGIDVGDTQTILLKKIEELTLYMIEQNKQMEQLQKYKTQLDLVNRKMEEQNKMSHVLLREINILKKRIGAQK